MNTAPIGRSVIHEVSGSYWRDLGPKPTFYTVEPTRMDLGAPSAEAHGTWTTKLRAWHAIWRRRSRELPHSELSDPKLYDMPCKLQHFWALLDNFLLFLGRNSSFFLFRSIFNFSWLYIFSDPGFEFLTYRSYWTKWLFQPLWVMDVVTYTLLS